MQASGHLRQRVLRRVRRERRWTWPLCWSAGLLMLGPCEAAVTDTLGLATARWKRLQDVGRQRLVGGVIRPPRCGGRNRDADF